jgi:PTH1 family peptidyl-tRNA hydrolase
MGIFAIIGLGNPGDKYVHTRHNIGYHVVDKLCGRFRISKFKEKSNYYFATFNFRGEKMMLFRSKTYMNHSGIALKKIIENFELRPSNILVIYDDFALPLGTIRLRKSGSDGGHNGLASIIEETGTSNIPRLRLGIGPVPPNMEVVDFVLNKFSDQEMPIVEKMTDSAKDATITALSSGIDMAMSKFNGSVIETADTEKSEKEKATSGKEVQLPNTECIEK